MDNLLHTDIVQLDAAQPSVQVSAFVSTQRLPNQHVDA